MFVVVESTRALSLSAKPAHTVGEWSGDLPKPVAGEEYQLTVDGSGSTCLFSTNRVKDIVDDRPSRIEFRTENGDEYLIRLSAEEVNAEELVAKPKYLQALEA